MKLLFFRWRAFAAPTVREASRVDLHRGLGGHVGGSSHERAMMRRWRPHGPILLYRCVAAPSRDPCDVCVSPKRFEQQLAALSQVADPICLVRT
jgi:hypothetical protein